MAICVVLAKGYRSQASLSESTPAIGVRLPQLGSLFRCQGHCLSLVLGPSAETSALSPRPWVADRRIRQSDLKVRARSTGGIGEIEFEMTLMDLFGLKGQVFAAGGLALSATYGPLVKVQLDRVLKLARGCASLK